MTQEQLDINRALAKFMNIPVDEFHGLLFIAHGDAAPWDIDPLVWYNPSSDWNQLMVIVEKIANLDIDDNEYVIWRDNLIRKQLNTSILEVWEAVHNFVEWHNTKNK